MEHNQELIKIINELNAREAKQKEEKQLFVSKSQSLKAINAPEDSSDTMKSYLKKFADFKSKVKTDSVTVKEPEVKEELVNLVESVSGLDDSVDSAADFERYSRSDSRVFTNKAKRSETQVTSMRWKQYSNTRATLTNDSKMAPLRLDRYSS